VANGQEDAVIALERRVPFLPAAPLDVKRQCVGRLPLVAIQSVPLCLQDDPDRASYLPDLDVRWDLWRELSAGSIPARRITAESPAASRP
jgi:hypothetical protein